MKELIPSRVFYTFVDRSFCGSTHVYNTTAKNNSETSANIESIKKFFSLDKLVLLNQVHGNNIYFYKKEDTDKHFVTADGIITQEHNVGIAIKTADCVPILISDSSGYVICALHCGWRGAISDLIQKAVSALDKISNKKKYSAVIGPCINRESYQVDEKFMENFLQESALNQEFFYKKENNEKNKCGKRKIFFDLPEYARNKLVKNGISDITSHSDCTYLNKNLYPSYRREAQNNTNCLQRILSIICMKPKL